MQARPFRLVGDSDRQAVEATLRVNVEPWAGQWFAGSEASGIAPDVLPAGAECVDWLRFGTAPDRWLAVRPDRSAIRALLRRLVAGIGSGAPISPLGESLVRECIADFAARCLSSVGLAASPAVEGLPALEHGGGELAFRMGGEFSLLLGGALVEAMAAPRRAVVPSPEFASLRSAAGTAPIQIEVVLGDAELTLGDLAALAPGDVIRLDTRMSDPLAVRVGNGQSAFHAHLGRHAEHKVIQVSGK
jgi:hypothetical protein